MLPLLKLVRSENALHGRDELLTLGLLYLEHLVKALSESCMTLGKYIFDLLSLIIRQT